MLNDPDLRNITENTDGDFLAFELFDNDKWRDFRISLTALAVLCTEHDLTPLDSFEENVKHIKGVAFVTQAPPVGPTILNSDHFS